MSNLQKYAEQCAAERLAARLTLDYLSIPETDELAEASDAVLVEFGFVDLRGRE